MKIERERVKTLVREELARRLAGPPPAHSTHPALVEIYVSEVCSDDMDFPHRPRCVIEPDRPCYNSGYCKRLGY
jgi:hypothetical protein